jgi:TolB-like protein
MSGIGEFINELQRRSVVRAAVVHVLFFWALVQVADVVLPYIGVVDQPVRWAIFSGVGLFPLTLIVAWFFEHPWTHLTRGRVATDIVLIALIAIGASTWVLRNLPQVVHTKTSIVVMPFAHSGSESEESLSRALASEVNSLLMKSKSIDVIGFESATSAVLEGLTPQAIADRLDVHHVLAGTISAKDKRLRIDIRLLDRSGAALMDTVIEDNLDNLFSIQEDIAVSIEEMLGAGKDTVPVAEVAAQRCWMPSDPEAIEKYYTARYYIDLRTETSQAQEQMRAAIRYYEELIQEYRDFAEAYSGLAWAQLYQSNYDPASAVPDPLQNGIALAETAVQLCPSLTEAIHFLPNQWGHPNPWVNSYQQLTAFIDLEPDRSENYQKLSRHYRDVGLNEQSLAIAERDYSLNPLGPRTVRELASSLMKMRRWDEAIAMFDLATELGSSGPNWARMSAPWHACDDVACLLERLPPDLEHFRPMFEQIYITPTSDEEARAAIDAAMALVREVDLVNWFNGSSCQFDYLTPLFFELFDYFLDNEQRLYWHWPNAFNPECGNVWADPKFADYVEELGLDEYWRETGAWPDACRPDGESFTCRRP